MHREGTWCPECPQLPREGPQPKSSDCPGKGVLQGQAQAASQESKARNGGLRAAQEPEGRDFAGSYLGDNELRILRTVQLQLLGNIGQGDAGIGEADHTDACGEEREWSPPGQAAPGLPSPQHPPRRGP